MIQSLTVTADGRAPRGPRPAPVCHHPRVQRRGASILALAAAVALLIAAVLAQPAPAGTRVKARAADSGPVLAATVGATATGQAMPRGFLGLSLEYKAVHQYAGRNPLAINPVLIQLIRYLAPGQAPVLRIGGDSTDSTWWPTRGVIQRGGISYALTKGWLRTTRALAVDLGAKLIMGINLASGRPALAATEAGAILQGIGRRYIDALEVGNEPDLYGAFAWYRDRRGRVVHARSRRYSLSSYTKEFWRFRAVLPRLPLVGPSFSSLTWLSGLGHFLATEKSVRTVTIHRYPLHNSTTDPSNPTYPSIPDLLADTASSGLAQQLAPYVRVAHGRGLPFRVDEMNSVSGAGHAGVSDTFASALWVLDALFNMAAVGVDGVNIHTLPNAGYELFTFSNPAYGWQAFVHPEYYGMLLFAQAFPPGARLLPVSSPAGPVKVWATAGRDGRTRVVLINKDPTTPATVQLSLPQASGPASLERLTAPSLAATNGVTLAGQTFGDSTQTGTLVGVPQTETVSPVGGSYAVDLPAGSAAMLTH
jgi:Glycosyl hydrolase family 79 C-terminal beta domain